MLINILMDFYHLLFFSVSLFHTLKFVINYFQFVNFTHPQEALQNWNTHCNLVLVHVLVPLSAIFYSVNRIYNTVSAIMRLIFIFG